ncbi:MAG: hypothetical protein R2827_14345 [Bdellovibrionales bacterium]
MLGFELDWMEYFVHNPFDVNNFEKDSNLPGIMMTESYEFNHPDEKTGVMGEFSKDIKKIPDLKNYFMELIMVADELILNALFEGPQFDIADRNDYNVDYPDNRNNELILCRVC